MFLLDHGGGNSGITVDAVTPAGARTPFFSGVPGVVPTSIAALQAAVSGRREAYIGAALTLALAALSLRCR